MPRHLLTLLVVSALAASLVFAQPAPEKERAADDVGEQSTRLEAELAKYHDTAPEAADVMAQLTDMYYSEARVFGLIRIAQRFIAAHPDDKRHSEVMLRLMDGLEATSRNKELTVVCRQFLARYPEADECGDVEVRLAQTLQKMGETVAAADAWRLAWERQPNVKGRQYAAKAVSLYILSNDKNVYSRGAELAEEMLAKLPKGQFAEFAGLQAVHQWRRGSEWARSNVAAGKLLAKGLPADKDAQRELHYYMALNSGTLGQHANAAESYRKALALGDSPQYHFQAIHHLYHSAAPPKDLKPLVDEYVQKYPQRPDRFVARSHLAHAYLRADEKPAGLAILAELLPFDAVTNGNAAIFLQENGGEPPQLAASERVLRDAIQKNPAHAAYLRYVLGFSLYRDRLKDEAKARQTLLELATVSPSDDHHSWAAVDWLLTSAGEEPAFRAEVARLLAARKEHIDLASYRNWLGNWAKTAARNKDLKPRADYVQAELARQDADPLVKLWLEVGNAQSRPGEPARAELLQPANFNKLNDRQARKLLEMQGPYYWHYSPANQRSQTADVYGQMARRFPKDYQAALWYLQTAHDYAPPEVAKEAALHLLTLEPEWQQTDIWYRLMATADRNQDAALARQALAWILKSQQKHGDDPLYAAQIGDVLNKYEMEQEAVAYWTVRVTLNRNHAESRDCALRLLPLKEGDEKVRFLQDLFQHETDFLGRYAEWLADHHIKAGDIANFEKVLREARKRQDERPFRYLDIQEHIAQTWTDAARNNEELSDANKRRVFTVVRDLELLRASATAALALLEITPDDAQDPMARLLAYQATTRLVGNDSHDWDRLMPWVQAALGRQDYMAAATLLTGMLANIPNTEATRKQAGRELAAQSYARLGTVGLTIDERSPTAPLMQAALYLRLGDDNLAFETWSAHRALFDEHRHEVPVDLIVFVCDRLIAGGGDENHERVEDILRGWLVRNGDSQHVEDATKAQVQLLLGRNFFKAQRYDLARTEFTTIINRYPKNPQAIDAEFAIGETFLAQKVYDQAEAVFEKLAGSRDADIMVRAEFLRGVLAYRRDDRDEARAIFRTVLERVPNIELANQALFNLAEVYGDEERYIDQLNLLRTVGRLGRASKRWHAPGTSLSIVVQDSDLGISRGHNRIPVRVTTEPGGDSEVIFLTSGGAGKGLFRGDLETRLGQAVPGDRVLQLTGQDIIHCDYPDEFKAEFKNVPLSDVEIRIASDAKLEMASGPILDEQSVSFSEQLRREAEEQQELAISERRPRDQIKPGNPIYLRVTDPDRSISEEPDKVVVKLDASSGDQVQVTLAETGPHTGVFEGTVRTDELPAGALASDTSIQHSPLMAIDHDLNTFWMSEPDGATPKFLSVDMKDLKYVSRVKISSPRADRHAPVRGTVLGSNDGEYWFRLASNPPEPLVEPLDEDESGRMTRRIFAGNHTGYTEWNQIANLWRNSQPNDEAEADGPLVWKLPEDDDEATTAHSVMWHGRLVKERPGAARLHVNGMRTAVAVNGRVELPPGPGGRHVDVWLEGGTHDVTIFAATTQPVNGVEALWAEADYNVAQVPLRPFRGADFDLEQRAARGLWHGRPDPEDQPKLSVADGTWEFQFPPVELRYVKLMIHEYLGEAVAINRVEIAGDEPDEVYVPTETDVLSLATNDILEMAGGDVVTATYADEFTQSESGRSRLLTARLIATYYNGQITPIAYEFRRERNGAVTTIRKQLMRIEPGERFIVEIIDYDMDHSDLQDTLTFQLFVNDGEPVEFTATETDPHTGVFTKEIDTSAGPEEGKLHVRAGDRIYCRYLDAQNTFPGHAVPRETVVYVNEPSAGQLRIYETRMQLPAEGSNAAPQVSYRAPERGQAMSGVAFESPLTVEVIDPDAAKDSRSSVTVRLLTSDGATVDVRCVISAAHVPGISPNDITWALREGRFLGQVILQLGGKNSPQTVALTSEMPRNLIGGPVIEDQSALDRTLITKVLNLTGKDVIAAAYRDERRPNGPPANLAARGRLISNGQLAITDRDYQKEVTQLHVGEKLFLMVTDFDQDSSDERDVVFVEVSTERGEREIVPLEETLAHSGVFTGSFQLKPSEEPTPENLDPADLFIETWFGDTIRVRYLDKTASTESGELEVLAEVPVVVGTDGLVAAFSKTFNDEKLAVETKFHIAESYFELFKSHKKLGRESEQQADLEAGRRVLREVMEDYPDPQYVPRIAYLLGQFAQELAQWHEAIESYEMIVRQFPDHTLAPDAQYKLAQCHEDAGNFDQALEAYVTLAATYPKSPLIASVMIRISDYFYKNENYDVAAQVGEKFLERFESHQFASRMAFRVGQCYFKAKLYPKAGDSFDLFSKRFPDDVLCADALFWSGESFRLGSNNREAFRRYNRCRWDFPESDAAKYSRGRLALPEMLSQFEAEATSIDMQP